MYYGGLKVQISTLKMTTTCLKGIRSLSDYQTIQIMFSRAFLFLDVLLTYYIIIENYLLPSLPTELFWMTLTLLALAQKAEARA